METEAATPQGRASRTDELAFEPLAANSVMDMRWKKFIYRRLCRWGGFNTCKAPSRGACPTYEECFGGPA